MHRIILIGSFFALSALAGSAELVELKVIGHPLMGGAFRDFSTADRLTLDVTLDTRSSPIAIRDSGPDFKERIYPLQVNSASIGDILAGSDEGTFRIDEQVKGMFDYSYFYTFSVDLERLALPAARRWVSVTFSEHTTVPHAPNASLPDLYPLVSGSTFSVFWNADFLPSEPYQVVGYLDTVSITPLPPSTPSAVPEPATYSVVGAVLLGIAALTRRRF